jgi:glycosyltransferase involved in cell wall biosynthesis
VPEENPLVSIVTVVRNGERHLPEAIESVLSQNYAPLEYVVIDGASTDGTVDIIRKYEDDLAYWTSEPDRGVFDAMNKGIRRSTGRLIKLLNADDRLTRNSIALAVEAFAARPTDKPVVIYGEVTMIDERGMPLGQLDNRRASNPVGAVLHPSWYVDRQIYETHGLYEQKFWIGADFEMYLRLHRRGVPFCYINEPLAEFRSGGQSGATWPAIADRYRILREYFPRGRAVAATLPFAFRKLRRLALVTAVGEDHTYRLRAKVVADDHARQVGTPRGR